MTTRANPAVVAAGTLPDIQTQKPFVAFQPGDVPPTQAVYLQLNDAIFIRVVTNSTFPSAVARYRYLTPQGEIKEGVLPINIQVPIQVFTLPLGEAWLLTMLLDSNNSGGAGSWFYAQIGLARGLLAGGAFPTNGLVWEGYVANGEANGWPGGATQRISDGSGIHRMILGSTPAAGADISEVVPSNRRWQLIGLVAVLTASAAVANRFVRARIDNGGSAFCFSGAAAALTASQVGIYSMGPGLPAQSDGQLDFVLSLPTLVELDGTFRIQTNTLNIQAGDQWAQPAYFIREWGAWN